MTSPTTTLTLGTQVNGSISQIGQQNLYTFSLANASQLYFDSLTNDSSLNWTLTGPRGTEVGGRGFTSSDSVDVSGNPALSLVAGNYTLSVAANGEHTGNYSFRLSNLASAAVLTPGTAMSGSLSGGTASNLYQFNAQAGDQFYFDAQSLTGSTSNTNWRLTDPYGQQLWSSSFIDVGPRSLTASGTYTLLVEGRIFATSQIDYTFNAQKLTNTTAALTLGTQVNGAITQPGQQAAYTFTLANSSQLYFDSLTNDNSLNWTLTGPRGTEVTSRSFTASDGSTIVNPVLSLVAGNYTLTVTGFADHTGSYSFRVSDLGSATPVTPGNPVSGTLPSGNNTNLYRFDAQAGDQVVLTQQSVSGGSPSWRLIDPYGGVVYSGAFSTSGTLTLQSTGTYSLLLEGSIDASGAIGYTFNVSPQGHVTISPPTGTALTLGAVKNGTISTSGQQDSYVFTIATAASLYFDSLTSDGSLTWSLSGPRGAEVNSRSFQSSDDGSFSSSNPVLNLIAGNYVLTVTGTAGHTGSYGFRVLDLASAPAVATASNNGGQNGSGDITVTTDNHSMANAINLDGQFALTANPEISNSTTVPHVSIHATGAGAFDYYKFTVSTGGTIGIFDIDHASWDTYLNLFELIGNAARVQ